MAAGEPETLYQQNHCGVYRSTTAAHTGPRSPTTGCRAEFGVPDRGPSARPRHGLGHPAQRRDGAASCPDGKRGGLADARPRRVLDPQRAGPAAASDAYLTVLREAMARDTLDPVGITFGTKTGQLWQSSDEGDSWRHDHRRPAGDLGGRGGRRSRADRAMATSCSRARSWPCSRAPSAHTRSPGGPSATLLVALDALDPGPARPARRGGPAPATAHQRLRGRPAGRPDDTGRRPRRPSTSSPPCRAAEPALGRRCRPSLDGAPGGSTSAGRSEGRERVEGLRCARRPRRRRASAADRRRRDRRRSPASRGRRAGRASRSPRRPSPRA